MLSTLILSDDGSVHIPHYDLPKRYQPHSPIGAGDPCEHFPRMQNYRVQQRWGELADLIDAQLEHTTEVEAKFDLHLAIADICESQLASTPRAIDAYESALALDTNVEDAFVALERLFRQSEHWGKLAKVLERKADFLEKSGNAAQAWRTR